MDVPYEIPEIISIVKGEAPSTENLNFEKLSHLYIA